MKRASSAKSGRRPTARTPRNSRTHTRGAATRREGRTHLGPSPGDLVIVSRALADLAESLRFPQEASGRGRVVLDRRLSERRRAGQRVEQDRRQGDRRRPPTNPTEALMRVLGFMVVPTAEPTNGSTARPRVKPPPAKSGRATQPALRPRGRRRRA